MTLNFEQWNLDTLRESHDSIETAANALLDGFDYISPTAAMTDAYEYLRLCQYAMAKEIKSRGETL